MQQKRLKRKVENEVLSEKISLSTEKEIA